MGEWIEDDLVEFEAERVDLETCPECGGEGGKEVSKPQRDDPYFAVWVPCGACNQSGFV